MKSAMMVMLIVALGFANAWAINDGQGTDALFPV